MLFRSKQAGIARKYLKNVDAFPPTQMSNKDVIDHAKLTHRLRKLNNNTNQHDTEYVGSMLPHAPTHKPVGGHTRRHKKRTHKRKHSKRTRKHA